MHHKAVNNKTHLQLISTVTVIYEHWLHEKCHKNFFNFAKWIFKSTRVGFRTFRPTSRCCSSAIKQCEMPPALQSSIRLLSQNAEYVTAI